MNKKQSCRDCIHLQHDGFCGIWCGVNGNNKNYDCQKYEKKRWRIRRMNDKGLTVKELYDLLEPLIDKYGDLEVRVSYDSGLVATNIRHKEPQIVLEPMREYSFVKFEGW